MAKRSISSPRLLLVLEEKDLGRVLGTFLQEEGYKPLVATSPQEALSLLETQRFDLIVSDFFRPYDVVPYTTVGYLHHAAHPTPVGILAASQLTALEVAQRGFAFLLSKPFDLEDLSAHIAASLRMSQDRAQKSRC